MSVVLLSKNGILWQEWLVHPIANSHKCFSSVQPLLGCSRSALHVLPITSHKIWKRCIFKHKDSVKYVIFTTSLRTSLRQPCFKKKDTSAKRWRIQWAVEDFGSTTLIDTNAPVVSLTTAFAPSLQISTQEKKGKIVLQYHYENCLLHEPLTGSQGPKGIHRPHFENFWPTVCIELCPRHLPQNFVLG